MGSSAHTSAMMVRTLNGSSKRSEEDDNEANSRDYTVSSSPVKGPGSLLFPAHPPPFEERPLPPRSEPISQGKEHSATSEQRIPLTEYMVREHLDSNPDLNHALEIYLNYLPLIPKEVNPPALPLITMQTQKNV